MKTDSAHYPPSLPAFEEWACVLRNFSSDLLLKKKKKEGCKWERKLQKKPDFFLFYKMDLKECRCYNQLVFHHPNVYCFLWGSISESESVSHSIVSDSCLLHYKQILYHLSHQGGSLGFYTHPWSQLRLMKKGQVYCTPFRCRQLSVNTISHTHAFHKTWGYSLHQKDK